IILSFGATIGKVGIAETNLATKQGIAGIELKDDKVFNLFFYYVLITKKNELLRLTNQTTIPEIRPNIFISKLSFLLPPLPEQHKIAEILETVDNAIEKTDDIIEKYNRIKQGLMHDLLTKGIDENWQIRNEKTHKFKDSPIGRIPEEWEVMRLGEVAERITNGFVYSFSNIKKDGIPITRIETISEGYIDKNKLGYISEALYPYVKKYQLKTGDILFSHINSLEHVGKTAIYNNIPPFLIHGMNLLLLRFKNSMCYPFFLIYLLKKENIRNKIKNLSGQAVNQVSIKPSELSNFKIPLPPLPEQERIATVLSQIDEVIEKEKAYKEKLEGIKKGLMEDLLTGKVRVNHLIEEESKDEIG
ncbi:MAG: restriction endonuclease subunit S, partial [Thermodesulfobium narugense]